MVRKQLHNLLRGFPDMRQCSGFVMSDQPLSMPEAIDFCAARLQSRLLLSDKSRQYAKARTVGRSSAFYANMCQNSQKHQTMTLGFSDRAYYAHLQAASALHGHPDHLSYAVTGLCVGAKIRRTSSM